MPEQIILSSHAKYIDTESMPISRIYNVASSRRRKSLSYARIEAGDSPLFKYGKFGFDHTVDFLGLTIGFEGKNGMYQYTRDILGWTHESNIAVTNGSYYLQPIEPLNLPDNVTDFIEIEFDAITIEPNTTAVVFLTFPIEIGVFLESSEGKQTLLDIVTFTHPKFSLYGAASRGVVTRFHKSSVFSEPPQVKNYQEGILRLEIQNNTNEWTTVGRAIIYQKGFNLYYDETVVSACAKMTIQNTGVADVFGYDMPLHPNMHECLQVFEPRRTTPFCNIEGALLDSTFTMDMGVE